MSYPKNTIEQKNKEKAYKMALKAAETSNAIYVQDVYEMIGISRSTFYHYFPNDSEQLDNIKRELRRNRSNIRMTVRDNMLNSKSSSSYIGLLKIVGTDDEKKALNNTIEIQGISSKDIESMANAMRDSVTFKEIDKE